MTAAAAERVPSAGECAGELALELSEGDNRSELSRPVFVAPVDLAPPPRAEFVLPSDLVGIDDGGDGFEANSKAGRALKPEDFVPCTRCGLRGHVAGDPERCLAERSLGLGQSPWMGGQGV
jgi:hypothetical protein